MPSDEVLQVQRECAEGLAVIARRINDFAQSQPNLAAAIWQHKEEHIDSQPLPKSSEPRWPHTSMLRLDIVSAR